MTKRRFSKYLLYVVLAASGTIAGQDRPSRNPAAELRLHIVSLQPEKQRTIPAVIWLKPLDGTSGRTFLPHGHYTLLQKNRTFIPHLQVIPVGSAVQFPNADPFFHNVFSLFNGKRFDLGLYEAGSSKAVTFPREGVSYIFCNIHPEMSAVVVALTTPLYAIADANDSFVLRNIPPGNFRLHVWIEGVPLSVLNGLARPLHLSAGIDDLGELKVPIPRDRNLTHANKFGRAYDTDSNSTY